MKGVWFVKLGCWLGSSHSFKGCVTAHQSKPVVWLINIFQLSHHRSFDSSLSRIVCSSILFFQSLIGRTSSLSLVLFLIIFHNELYFVHHIFVNYILFSFDYKTHHWFGLLIIFCVLFIIDSPPIFKQYP